MWSFFPNWSHAQNHANSSTHSCPVWWPADPLAAGCSYRPTIKLFSQSKLRDERLAILILIIVISCFCLRNFFDPFQRMHEYASITASTAQQRCEKVSCSCSATGGPWMPSMIMTWLLSYSQTARIMKISLHAMIVAIIFGHLHKFKKNMLTCFCSMISHMTRLSHKPSTMTYQKQVSQKNIPSSKFIISIYHITFQFWL
jgi:hypothetical protein